MDNNELVIGWHTVDLPHEGTCHAIFYVLAGTAVVATCKVDPWGKGKRGFMSGLCVDSNLRRRGIGRQVVRGVMDAATLHGMPAISMWVNRDNKPAQRLYETEGFHPYFDQDENIFYARLTDYAQPRQQHGHADASDEAKVAAG